MSVGSLGYLGQQPWYSDQVVGGGGEGEGGFGFPATPELHLIVRPSQEVDRPVRPEAPVGEGDEIYAALRYFNYRKTTIFAGSNEIQRNIIAKHVLGL